MMSIKPFKLDATVAHEISLSAYLFYPFKQTWLSLCLSQNQEFWSTNRGNIILIPFLFILISYM